MPTPPNLIAAFVQIQDEESLVVKLRSNADLSTKEEFVYLTYLQQAIKEQADKVKAQHEREQRRQRALEQGAPRVHSDNVRWKPSHGLPTIK